MGPRTHSSPWAPSTPAAMSGASSTRTAPRCWSTRARSSAAVRAALLQAQRSVFIVGWDLDSRTRLVGEDCAAHDGWPVTLREFLVAPGRRAAGTHRASARVGFRRALRARARAVSLAQARLEHAGARALPARQCAAGRRLASPEDHRGRRRARVLRRARPHDPALGHLPARHRRSAPLRSGRPAVSPVPRRADGGRRRGRARARRRSRASAGRARPASAMRRSRRAARPGRTSRRTSPMSRSRSRARCRYTTTRTRCARSRRCSTT